MFERIVIEAERSGDSRTLFRLQVDGHLIRKGLTVGHVQVLLRELLDRISPPSPHTKKGSGPGVRLRSPSGNRGQSGKEISEVRKSNRGSG
jgi:hypothetical protein